MPPLEDKEVFTTLYLIRHGEVDEAYHRKFGGTINMGLSPVGHHQARLLAEYLQRFSFDALYCSPMKRAMATADPIAQEKRLDPITVEGLREIDFGVWTGKTWMEVRDEFQIEVFKWLDYLEAGEVEGAELGADFRKRVGVAADEIVAKNVGKHVAVVCHGGVVRAMMSHLLDIPMGLTGKLDIEYASVTRLQISGRKAEATLVNLVPWLDLA